MTEGQAKPAPDLKARIANVRAHVKATYEHYRYEIAHHHVLSNLSPQYRAMLGHVAETINSTCQNAGVRLIPEDVVIILASAMLLPLSYYTLRNTYLFHLTFHTYFAFCYPVMVSVYDAESGDNVGAGNDLVGWVLLSLWTVLERIVPNGERGYERLWYLALKCGFSYGLFSPKLDGAAALVRFVVRPKIMPALGIDGGGVAAAKATTATKKKAEAEPASSSSSSAAAAASSKLKDAPATTEESDASTQDSKESSGFSFVEKSELEAHEQQQKEEEEQPQPKTIHLKIESIEGTEWNFPAGGTKKAEFEGPYLVFDVIDKSMDDVSDFMPPSHAETVAGKKVRTPVGTLVEDDDNGDDDNDEKEEAVKGEEEAAEKAGEEEMAKEEGAAEPDLEEEQGTEKQEKSDEKEGGEQKQAVEEDEGKEKEAGAGKKGTEGAAEESVEKEEKADEPSEEEKAEEEEGKAEPKPKGDNDGDKPEAKGGSAEEEQEEEKPAAAPADQASERKEEEEEEKKPEKTSASFSWPGTALLVPVVIPPQQGKGDGGEEEEEEETKPPRRLLRVVAYDKRTIGSDAFFGVAYAVAPIGGDENKGDKEVEALVLRDGRTKVEGGSAAEVGGVSMVLSRD